MVVDVPEPASQTDPLTTILVSLTELRGEVRAALGDLKRHDSDITTLYAGQNNLRDRVTVLEAQRQGDEGHQQKMVSARAVAYSGGGVVAAVVGAIAAWRTGGG